MSTNGVPNISRSVRSGNATQMFNLSKDSSEKTEDKIQDSKEFF